MPFRGTGRRGLAPFAVATALLAGCSPCGALVQQAPDCVGRLGVARVIPVHDLRAGTAGTPVLALQEGEVVLTFDDGPANGTTQDVLAALAEECVSATFFLLGQQVDRDRTLARRVASAGHTIGTHTHAHANLTAMPLAEAAAEVQRGIAAVRRALPASPLRLFRFPFLADSPALLDSTREAGLLALRADLDGEDWEGNSCGEIVERIMGRLDVARRGVILLHDTMQNTACATRSLLHRLQGGGYRIVHLGD